MRNTRTEYAAYGSVNPEVLADFRALQQADARGELRGYRAQGVTHFRVLRTAHGRLVVPADNGNTRVARRRTPAQRLAAFDAEERERRLAQAERECAPALRQRRLERLENVVYHDVVARLGGPILRPGR
jgi:hypothetical protein